MKSILIGLVLLSWIACYPAYTQDESASTKTYCLPIETARLLVEDALRLRLADSINNSLAQRVHLLETEKLASYHSFTNLLKLSEQKYQTQKENTGHMERLALSYKSERDYYIKRERKQRRGKNVWKIAFALKISFDIIKGLVK